MEENDERPLEYQVLALSFRQPGAVEFFVENLSVEAVASAGNRGLAEFYEAIKDFYNKTGVDVIDPIAFQSWLSTESDIYKSLGGPTIVQAFIETFFAMDLSAPDAVTGVLNYRFNKRKQLASLQELQTILTKKGPTSEEENQRISGLTEEIRFLEQSIGYNPLERVMTGPQIAMDAERLFDLPDFLPTPFPALNRALAYSDDGGFVKGSVHAILAQSGMGKSTFAKVLMNHWCDQGFSGIYVNYEEAKAHWERILFAQITGENVYLSKDMSSKIKEDAVRQFKARMAKWGDRFMVRHDPDTPYFDDLEVWLRDINGHAGRTPDFLIIDTIQSMFMKGAGGKPRWGQFEEMIVRLEKLAKDMNSVFIITSQENTNRMKERREVVMQSDAGGSITIVQKCAVTIFMVAVKNEDEHADEHVMELQIPKNRITGQVFKSDHPKIRYDDKTKSFEAWDEPTNVYEESSYNKLSYIGKLL